MSAVFTGGGGPLRHAKFPQVLQGFVEVLLNRQVPYTVTPKQRSSGRRRLLLWPHLLASIMIGGAWIMGMARGTIEYPSLHVWAALLVTVSLALVATELRRSPDPYDRALQLEARSSSRDFLGTLPNASRTITE